MQVQQLPVTSVDTVLYFEQVNITFEEVHLINVDASAYAQILRFNQSNIIIKHLISRGCSTKNQLIQVVNCSGSDGRQMTQIINSKFQGGQGQGRALYIEASNLYMRNTSFDGFSSNGGGAMQVYNSNTGSKLIIRNCTFINNNAIGGNFGGALLLESPYVAVSNSIFMNNSAVEGGGLYIASEPRADGGYWPDEAATFDECTFTSNPVSLRGGPMYVAGSQGANNQTIHLKNSYFANHYQGETLNPSTGPNFWGVPLVIVDGCTFVNNSYMYVYGYFPRVSSLFVLNSVFLNNIGMYNLTDATSDRKGDINEAGEVSGVHAAWCRCVGVYNTSFANNIGAGLALRNIMGDCEKDGSAAVYPPLFNRSTIAGDEGSQWIINNTNTDPLTSTSVDIRQSQFANNVDPALIRAAANESLLQVLTGGGGGLIMMEVHRSVLADLLFENNQGVQGGAVQMDSCSITIMWNLTFSNNSASQQGGAIATTENQLTDGIFMGAITASKNKAQSGAAIYADGGASLTITNSSYFEGNVAATRGAALHCINCQTITVQLGVVIKSNSAGQSGGAVFLDSCDEFTANDVQFTNNR